MGGQWSSEAGGEGAVEWENDKKERERDTHTHTLTNKETRIER